jgi:hypothetical protein
MARQTLEYTITDDNRDNGKTFVITELSASKAEAWALRAIMALIGANVQVPEGFQSMGMAGMAEIGFKALSGLKWDVAEPLLQEMWDCIKIKSSSGIVRNLIEEDIEELQTRIKLRLEVWKLHVGFLKTAAHSTLEETQAAVENQSVSRVIKTYRKS